MVGFATEPERRHLVHTSILLTLPRLSRDLTLWRLGRNLLLFRLLA